MRKRYQAEEELKAADPKLDELVKIEKKKKFKKTKSEMKRVEQELQKLLDNPVEEGGTDRAIELYDQQQLEAKKVTTRDKRRLRRLKQKAE